MSTATDHPHTVPLPGGIPPDHKPHTESTTTILVPTAQTAFLNPVQQYNRDLSVAVIRAWNEMRCEELEAKWNDRRAKGIGKKKKKGKGKPTDEVADKDDEPPATVAAESGLPEAGPSSAWPKFKPPQFTILEALSATGLRSIRYAKEIPGVRVVLANDISASACEAMRMNVAFNGVGEPENPPVGVDATQQTNGAADANETPSAPVEVARDPEEAALNGDAAPQTTAGPNGRRPGCKGHVRVNQGDACALMYQHRAGSQRVEVVDLDPYGTAAPFVDAALGCVTDGGLLCVTCTDLAVLAGSQYPEKCFSNYGGVCVNTEYSHEVALRLVLNLLATTAGRYGRYITPLLSLSIDFYCRIWVRVGSRPEVVKRLAADTGTAYVCSYCHNAVLQPFGRIVERDSNKGHKYEVFRTSIGPTASGSSCEECGSTMHVGGPMWLGPLHDPDFVSRVLKGIEGKQSDYGTWTRMHGMLSVARDELTAPFYFTSNRVHGAMHATTTPTSHTISALLNAGYDVSRSHASQGSIKTNAPRSFIFDTIREHIKTHPVRMDKIADGSPARRLIEKPMTHSVDFTPHKDVSKFERGEKVVFYQVNPTVNWGPLARAKAEQVKRKAAEPAPDQEAKDAKVAKVEDPSA